MPLGTADTIRDAAINRGIGTSGLVGQAIQRSNIEETRDLGQALATARATLENTRQNRLTEFQKTLNAGALNPRSAPTSNKEIRDLLKPIALFKQSDGSIVIGFRNADGTLSTQSVTSA